jgi:lipoprotein-releasing system permease protein
VRTSDRWRAERVAAAVSESLGFPFFTRDWQEQNRSLFQALKLEKLGMSVILLLIVLVAAFNIVSTLTMVVTDKTREIGILKAMGLPARSVRRIFFLQGLVIGLVGTLGGTLLGLIASIALGHYKLIRLDPSVYFIDHLPGVAGAARHHRHAPGERRHRRGGDALPGAAGGQALPARGHPTRMSIHGAGRSRAAGRAA